MENYYRNTWIEIDLDNIKHNINEIKEKCSKDKYLFAVIKGDAYGHGLKQVSDIVVESSADGCAVATLDEALLVKKYHKDLKTLVLGIIPDEQYQTACDNDITLTIATKESAQLLASLNLNKELLIHIKVNTGMNRIGFIDIDEIKEAITILEQNKKINIEGIFTHFATAEDYDKEDYLMMQLNRFKEVVTNLNYDFKYIHCTNSASLLKLHEHIDFTTANRCGIVLYCALEDKVLYQYDIKPTFKLKSKIAQVQVYEKGKKIGYSIRYTTEKDNEIIATIPIGYADGFARAHTLSKVKVKEQYGTIVGSICMDQLMIRFDDMVHINDEVILIDGYDKELNVFTRCKQAQTITHEIFTRFGNRVPKLYYKNKELVEIDNALLKK
ncbi:MAG: alanine racemase [Bacilli bacterium]|jgi:alanine racemase|nr:alanine racemase [Bacilli bacterium]